MMTPAGRLLEHATVRWPVLQRLPLMGPCRLLAVETDGFNLRAAVLQTQGHDCVIEQAAASAAADWAVALGDALDRLRLISRELPTHAILRAPGVIPAVLDLPVDPARPRPALQMQELLRWELEPVLAEQRTVWPVGAVLIGRGYLTHDQAQQIHQELDKRNQEAAGSPGKRRPAPRFGDLAVELGLVTRERLDECLVIHQQLGTPDDEEIACGWSAQPGSMTEEPARHRWLACGLNRTLRERWVTIFLRHGLRLLGIYPLIGCGAAALNGAAAQAGAAVFEAQVGLIGYTRLDQGRVIALQVRQTGDHPPSEDTCLDLVGSGAWDEGVAGVWVAGSGPHLPSLTAAITTRTRQDPRTISVPVAPQALPREVSPAAFAGVVGAARHALRLPGAGRCVCVPAQDPGPPLRQRVEVWAIAAACLAVAVIAAIEISLAMRLHNAKAVYVQAQAQLSQREEEAADAQARLDEVTRLEDSLATQHRALAAVEQRLVFLETTLPRRAEFLSALLAMLANAASDEVMLEHIEESDRHDIRIGGWALSDKAAQQFAQALAVSLRAWGVKVADFNVWSQAGRLGLPGFAMDMKLAPAPIAGSLAAPRTPENRP